VYAALLQGWVSQKPDLALNTHFYA
jgi:hypothetical protein